MQTITKHLVYLFLLVTVSQMQAQVQEQDSISKIESLKETIKTEERDALKVEVEAINDKLVAKEITYEEAEKLKKEAAEKRALNIENRIAVAVNRLEFMKRNDPDYDENDKSTVLSIKIGDSDKEILGIKTSKTPPKKNIRTTNQLLFAIGFNNALADGRSLSDSPYKLGGSGFVEFGWVWSTRVFKESNFLRLKYGLSLQWNKLDIKNDQFFVQQTNQTTLQPFAGDLKRAKFRTTSFVVPVHFEFGPSTKKVYKDGRIRYFNHDKFKIGIGGYAGINGKAVQKLAYKQDGGRVEQKIKRGYNTNTFTYGVSAYVGVGDVSLYAKYDLVPIFKNQLVEENNISLGLRIDLD